MVTACVLVASGGPQRRDRPGRDPIALDERTVEMECFALRRMIAGVGDLFSMWIAAVTGTGDAMVLPVWAG